MTEEKTFKLVITAASDLKASVGRELRNLGTPCEVEDGRAVFGGTVGTVTTASLWLRTADRIKIVVGEFNAYSLDELFGKAKAPPWEDYLSLGAEFPVAGKSIKSKLYSVPDCQVVTKKVIANRLKEVYHHPAIVPLAETGASFKLEVVPPKDKVTSTSDTTGPSLFKRDCHIEKGDAPPEENMAAALVMSTNWRRDRPFYDPICGSETIYIEAVLIGHNTVPGFNRNFTCETWDWADPAIFERICNEAETKADYDVGLNICGSDVDRQMVEVARTSAEEVGLGDSITSKQLALKNFTIEREYGVMVVNPPYGERLGGKESVRRLYKKMGHIFRSLTTWSEYVLTGDLAFEECCGAKAIKKRRLYNGTLRTDLFQYWGTHPPRKLRED